MLDFRTLRKASSCFRITSIFVYVQTSSYWRGCRKAHAGIRIYSNFMTLWNWLNMHPERVLILLLVPFLLRFSLPSCCPIWFKLCTRLLLIITSGSYFLFSNFQIFFSEKTSVFFVIFRFRYLPIVDSMEIFSQTFYLS